VNLITQNRLIISILLKVVYIFHDEHQTPKM
jgi:hypothetical protein